MRLSRNQKRALQITASALVLALAAWILVDVPKLTGSTWHDVRANLTQIHPLTILAIVALWLAGLISYTFAMTASMPGLSHRRALALNLSGSSVSNVLPFGGVVGTGLNVAMVKSWRLSLRSFASSTAVLNLVNLLAKLVLPVVAGLVVFHQKGLPHWLGHAAVIASLAAGLVVLVVVAALISKGWAVRVDALLRRISQLRPRHRGTPAGTGPGPVSAMQGEVRDIFRQNWGRLIAGLGGYVLLQWALFALCMHTAGIHGSPGAVFAAFAVERALTLAVVTPAGTGVAEVGATALLVALGFPAAPAAAGVLLYRLFVYLAEIPVGALVVAGWAAFRLRRQPGLLTNLSAGEAAGDVNAMPMPSTSNPPAASRR
jgi:putative heme transporter